MDTKKTLSVIVIIFGIIILAYSVFALSSVTIKSPSSNSNLSAMINLSATTAGNADNVTFAWINSTNDNVINETISKPDSTLFENTTLLNSSKNLPDGVYTVKAYANNGTDIVKSSSTSVTIDNTPPTINYISPGITQNNVNLSQNFYEINVSSKDSAGINTINITLFNSTKTLQSNQSLSGGISPAYFFVNFTNLIDGNYKLNITAKDSAGNSITESRNFTIDTTKPSVSLSKKSSTNSKIEVDYSCSDSLTGIKSCILSSSDGKVSGSTITDLGCGGSYDITLTAKDNAGNIVSTTKSFSTDYCPSSGSVFPPPYIWKKTYVFSDTELSKEGSIQEQLSSAERIQFKVSGTIYDIGVKNVDEGSALIQLSPNSKNFTLSAGQSKSLELNGDNLYDLLVKVNSVKDEKANISISYLHKKISEGNNESTNITTQEPGNQTSQKGHVQKESGSNMPWIIAIIIIVIIILILIGLIYYKKLNIFRR